MSKFVIKTSTGEYLQEESGDDCFTDDIGEALLYDEIPETQQEEVVVTVEWDEEEESWKEELA